MFDERDHDAALTRNPSDVPAGVVGYDVVKEGDVDDGRPALHASLHCGGADADVAVLGPEGVTYRDDDLELLDAVTVAYVVRARRGCSGRRGQYLRLY